MTHETDGSSTRDRHGNATRDRKGREHGRMSDPYAPYEQHKRETRDMPERHGTREEPRRSFDDDRDVDLQEGYR